MLNVGLLALLGRLGLTVDQAEEVVDIQTAGADFALVNGFNYISQAVLLELIDNELLADLLFYLGLCGLRAVADHLLDWALSFLVGKHLVLAFAEENIIVLARGYHLVLLIIVGL